MTEKRDMMVDINPIGMSINMVSVFISRKELKNGKVLRWEKKLKEKDEARPSRKVVWRPKPTKIEEAQGQGSSHRVSVFQRLQNLGQFQNRIRYHAQPKKESNPPNLVQKIDNRKGKEPEQIVVPKIIDHALPRSFKRAAEFDFEKGTPSLKITVLSNEQPKVKKMIKSKGEVKVEE